MKTPYSPLDAILNARPSVRKAAKVLPGDDALSVDARVAAVYVPIVKRIQEEAVAAERARLSAGVEMTKRDAWSVLDKVFFHLNDGDNGGAIEFIRTLIAEASARATAAERERCARWLREREQESLKKAKYFTDDIMQAGFDGEACAYNRAAEFIEQNPSAAAHRVGEGE